MARGDWIYAGFGLTMLGIAALLGLAAWYVSRPSAGRKPSWNKASEAPNLPAEVERA